jgi:hypothetical protein
MNWGGGGLIERVATFQVLFAVTMRVQSFWVQLSDSLSWFITFLILQV